MKKLILFIVLAGAACANQAVSGFCEQGNTGVMTAGLPSTTVVQGSFPSCTVSVFTAGTTNLITIFSDNLGTALANPFTANSSGRWIFYTANNQRIDIQLSGGGLPAPWSVKDVLVNDLNGGVIAPSNINNIRIVDGVKFAQSAAGINAANADLGSGVSGEIWIPTTPNGITATDAQISITQFHTLRLFGALAINAQTQGPILLGSYSRITCVNQSTLISNIGTGITSLIRAAVQDGSQTGMMVDGCHLSAGSTTVTNGVIDITGSTNSGWVRDNFIELFTSGWGIFAQDIQSGALNGTGNIQISNNRISASGTGACFELLHSGTNAVTLAAFDILDMICTAGPSSTNSALLQNTSAGTSLVRQINIQNLYVANTPAGQSALVINGAQQVSVRNLTCAGGSSANCVNIASNTNNSLISVDNAIQYSGNNALNDAANGITVLTAVQHYEFPNNINTYSFLPAVSYLKVNGLAPTSATGTGFGTGPAFALAAGSTNNAGTITVTAGTTPGSSGSVTVNFNTSQTVFGVNVPVCVWTLQNGTGSWAAGAGVGPVTNATTSLNTVNWSNNVTNLTATSTYAFNYWCAAK